MITKGSVSARKLRGGYYTPDDLAQIAVLSALRKAQGPIRKILEPSVGDGAFLPAISQRFGGASVSIVDVNADDLVKAAAFAKGAFASTVIYNDSFLKLAGEFYQQFDAAFGNPPFVRFQFLSASDKTFAKSLIGDVEIEGVSNLWIPLMVGVLRSLRPGGVFGFVIPQEFLSTKSAKTFRDELIRDFEELEVFFPSRGAFAEILQDVVIISGRKAVAVQSASPVKFVNADPWTVSVTTGQHSWIPYLLKHEQREAFDLARALPSARQLRSLAKFSVSTVTGANEFFCVNEKTRQEFELGPYTVPLLAKGADTQGLSVRRSDVAEALAVGRPTWLFRSHLPYSELTLGAQRYIDLGVALNLPERYKCAIRSPWYNVPVVSPKAMLMSKRAHRHPRVALNESKVTTTDTIYQGVAGPETDAKCLVASFHSSFTMLSCELEGRSYGGGVLELIPSEIDRLQVLTDLKSEDLQRLDELSRERGGQQDTTDELIKATDLLLAAHCPAYGDLLPAVAAGWQRLSGFRHRGIGKEAQAIVGLSSPVATFSLVTVLPVWDVPRSKSARVVPQ